MEFKKPVKNFKDIKQSFLHFRQPNDENVCSKHPPNLDSNVPNGMITQLSFKKLQSQRPMQQSFVSPPKQLVISAKPIENINLSSNKKKDALLGFGRANQSREDMDSSKDKRNVSNTSNRSGSQRKQLYNRFARLAENSSKQKDLVGRHHVGFNKLVTQRQNEPASIYQIDRKPTETARNHVKKPEEKKPTEQSRLSYIPKTPKQKIGQFFLRPSLQPEPTKLKQSIQSEFDYVNMSRQSVEYLDMSPGF